MSSIAPNVTLGRPRRPVRGGRAALGVAGLVAVLAALALLAGAGLVLWGQAHRDAAGYYTTPTERFATGSSAIVHRGVVVRDGTWLAGRTAAEVRIAALPSGG